MERLVLADGGEEGGAEGVSEFGTCVGGIVGAGSREVDERVDLSVVAMGLDGNARLAESLRVPCAVVVERITFGENHGRGWCLMHVRHL